MRLCELRTLHFFFPSRKMLVIELTKVNPQSWKNEKSWKKSLNSGILICHVISIHIFFSSAHERFRFSLTHSYTHIRIWMKSKWIIIFQINFGNLSLKNSNTAQILTYFWNLSSIGWGDKTISYSILLWSFLKRNETKLLKQEN